VLCACASIGVNCVYCTSVHCVLLSKVRHNDAPVHISLSIWCFCCLASTVVHGVECGHQGRTALGLDLLKCRTRYCWSQPLLCYLAALTLTQYYPPHTTQNVATAEVADALGGVPGFSDVTVYGVSVPDCDGKVGMAAVVLSEGTSAE
jgi:hypothetical protein